MDPDLIQALNDAWKRIAPILANDPTELARRLARRRSPTMLNPPRASCLAVRAADSRIDPWKFALAPDHPITYDHQSARFLYHPHQVTLEAKSLRWLCRPVSIPKPGLDAADAAKLLGVNRAAIMQAAHRGAFSIHYVKGLAGKRQHIPIVYTSRLLDPAGWPLGRMADIEWGSHWRYLSDHLPPDLSQTLTRVPLFRSDPGRVGRPIHRRPIPPDYVWYKWKSGQFHDPHLLRHPPRRRKYKSKLAKQPTTDNGPLTTDKTVFRGWRWLCPACKRQVTRLYYPLPLFTADFLSASLSNTLSRTSASSVEPYSGRGERMRRLPATGQGEGLSPSPSQGEGRGEGEDLHQIKNLSLSPCPLVSLSSLTPESPDSLSPPLPTFACEKCHRIDSYGFVDSAGWNHLITHLSGGLLFGHEVPKPPFLTGRRKRMYRPKSTSIPKTQQRIEPLLLHSDLDYQHIALTLKLPLGTVRSATAAIYKRHHVHTRADLRQALSPSAQQSKSAG